jgi:effector-binding domain-containing protein
MKKWAVWLAVILILTFAIIYLFIPSKLTISVIRASGAPISVEFRQVSQQDKWEKWWRDASGRPHISGEPFTYGGTTFRLRQIGYNAVGIEIEHDGIVLQSEMDLVSLNRDSTWARWNCQFAAGTYPLTRLRQYNRALDISRNMRAVLVNLKNFISVRQNAYDITVFKTTFVDTSMLSTRFISTGFPPVEKVYQHFDLLKKIIQEQKARITGYPMMNVRMLKTDSFETQLAIPTDRILQNKGNIFYRKMVPGHFLCAIVKGGRHTIDESMRQLEYFVKDNSMIQMASPFEQLITDRVNEPDSTKWITRIYMPVAE